MSGPIVAGVDGSGPATAALEWAAEEAARRGVPLRVVHVREPWAGEEEPHLDLADGEHREVLAEAADAARKHTPGVEVTTALVAGTVVGSLRAESETAALVVIGSRGGGGFAELLLGSVGMGLAGHARGPVVVVRQVPEGPRGEVVAGYDGSPHAETAVAFAVEEAALRGVPLRVLSAWPSPPVAPYSLTFGDLVQASFDAEVGRLRERVDALREENPAVDIRDEVVVGHPVPALTEASEQADLVVVGSRGKGPLASVLGSVSHGVLHHARCPVAVVRPPEQD
ncbi:universal stress protein [Sphaerisporangium rubeum]|uniref:Nucleotide-binding universal stress UspA family protein n=1 Tax=Sphaerisporangium rubeum TaxID=321317 RepID=A0A7X0IE03_9ACTN|nr:universal stress protein [Sphaerisporangium rubeum]MBB6473213.1 nucleotide-binding universal stress UspA family protein [Sphaerisporangium rubeum]